MIERAVALMEITIKEEAENKELLEDLAIELQGAIS